MIKYLLIFISFFISEIRVIGQDTVSHNKGRVIRYYPRYEQYKPCNLYLINGNLDTIIYYQYISLNKVILTKFVKYNGDLWCLFYKNGVIREIGAFDFPSKKSKRKQYTNRTKKGTWLYFGQDGKLLYSKTHTGNEFYWYEQCCP